MKIKINIKRELEEVEVKVNSDINIINIENNKYKRLYKYFKLIIWYLSDIYT